MFCHRWSAILLVSVAGSMFAQTEINCVIVMQYTPDISGKDTASNQDLLESAKKLAPTLDGDSEIGKVTSTVKLQAVFDAFAKGKRCCKKIVILSHGSTNGALDMPYELPKADDLPESERAAMGRELGGPAGKTGWGRDRLDEFVKTVKKVFCPNQKPAVSFDGCYTALEGGIAEQVAARGVGTSGYTGTCDFGYSEDKGKKEWHVPQPKEGTTSEEKKFPAK